MSVDTDRRAARRAAALAQPNAQERSNGAVKFACPGCTGEGHDLHRDNAVYFSDSDRWSCAWAHNTALDRAHWDAIGAVLGVSNHAASGNGATPRPDGAAAPAPWAWATSFRGVAITRAVIQRPKFLVDDLLSLAHQHAIIGPSGSAKSWLQFALAVAVAVPEVKSFLGQPVTVHGPVVIESWEQGVDEDLRRLQKLLRGHGLTEAPETLILQSMPFLTLQDETAYQARLRDLRDAQVVLYAFDSLSEGAGIELNDNTAYTAWWRARVRPLLALGITVVFTHLRGHLKPGTRGDRDAAFRGATQIRALSTAVIECRHLSATTSLVIHNKHRNTAELPLGILTLTGAQHDPAITLDLGALPDAAGKGDRARQQLIALARRHPAGITRQMIEDELNAPGHAKATRISKKIYLPALDTLVADGTFDTFTSAGKASAWFLVAAPEPGEDDEA